MRVTVTIDLPDQIHDNIRPICEMTGLTLDQVAQRMINLMTACVKNGTDFGAVLNGSMAILDAFPEIEAAYPFDCRAVAASLDSKSTSTFDFQQLLRKA